MLDQDNNHLRIFQSSCEASMNVEDNKTKTTQNKTNIKASMIYFKQKSQTNS